MKRILHVICIILNTIFAMFLVHTFNLFEYISGFPADFIEETGFTVYLAILEIIREVVFDKAELYIAKNRTRISCVFSKAKDEADMEYTPTVEVKSGNTICHVNITVSVKGKEESIYW